MTILVFPSVLEASARFAAEARRWGRRTVGASSLADDPNASRFDAWEHLPFIGDPEFFPSLGKLAARHGIDAIHTPHAPTFHLLEQELPSRLPGLRLFDEGPFRSQMQRVEESLGEAERSLETVSRLAGAEWPFAPDLLAGLLAKADTIHGECSREKMLALCATVPFAPPGDVIEIGALYGKSSYVLSRLAAFGGVGPTICVDPWDLGLSIQYDAPVNIQQASGGWNWETVYRGFLANMLGCAALPFNYLRATSAQAFEHYESQSSVSSREFGTVALSGRVSVLHLDGNHDEAAVAEDFAMWSRRMQPGGWIIFDDYNWPHGDGPRKVADRTLADYGTRIARHFVAGGAMFMKLAG